MRPSPFLLASVLSSLLAYAVPASAQDAAPGAASPPASESAPLPVGPDPDRWVLQGGGQVFSGLGSTLGEAQGNDFITELGIRGQMLFGRIGNRFVRIGPALEFRTAHFHTVEYAAGAMALFPTHLGWPLQLSVLGGYAHRFKFEPTHEDGPVLVTNLAFGYRPYNHGARYGIALNAYVSGRVHLDDPHAYEITGGIEFDVAMAYYVPALMIRMQTQRGDDPDETIDAEDLEEEQR